MQRKTKKDEKNTIVSLRLITGEHYDGEILNNKYNGKGRLVLPNGEIYIGEFIDGIRHGVGNLKLTNGVEYAGTFVKNKKEGYGALSYQNGTKYEGKFLNDHFDGRGTLKQSNGDKYEGQFRRGKRNGEGICIFQDGTKFEGVWFNDLPNQGDFVMKDGTCFKGYFKEDQFIGEGEIQYKNSEIYKGQWRLFKQHGTGEYYYRNGAIYQGQFEFGKKSGNGVMTYANNDEYQGQWKEDKKHGQGKMLYHNGTVQEGEWVADKMHGTGRIFHADGTIWEGKWENGDKKQGTFIYRSGVTQKGFNSYEVRGRPMNTHQVLNSGYERSIAMNSLLDDSKILYNTAMLALNQVPKQLALQDRILEQTNRNTITLRSKSAFAARKLHQINLAFLQNKLFSNSVETSNKIVSKNPATNKIIKEFSYNTNVEITDKIEKAHQGYQFMKKLTFSQRADKLNKLARLIENNQKYYAELITIEMGKPITQSLAEVKKSASHCKYYAENIDKYLRIDNFKSTAKKSYVLKQPIGTIYQIIPFNFPFWLAFKSGVPTLALGNSIIHKNSYNTPIMGLALEELFKEAGYENHEFQNVFASHEQTEFIISHEHIKGVSFTGSTQAGSNIAQIASKYVKKIVMELGGSDPFIVLQDADLNKAVNLAIQSRLQNCGQVCIAGKRFIIHEDIYDKFVEQLIKSIQSYKIGDPIEQTTNLGPLARHDLKLKILNQINEGIQSGAQMILDGRSIQEETLINGNYLKPCILECQPNNYLFQNETFGPVFALTKFKEEEEAIQIANNTKYGLGAVIITQDLKKAEPLSKLIDSGMVFINDIVKTGSNYPSGGIKNSGYGRECGNWGLEEFANIKTISINA